MLQQKSISPVLEETARVARAAFSNQDLRNWHNAIACRSYTKDMVMAGRFSGCVAKTSGSLVEVVFVLTVSRSTHLVHEPLFPL